MSAFATQLDAPHPQRTVGTAFAPAAADKTSYEIQWDDYSRWWDSEDGLSRQHKWLGDEWGEDACVDSNIRNFVLPYISKESKVLEIGPGGGRYTAIVAGHCGQLIGLDVSAAMIERVRKRIGSDQRFVCCKGNGHDLADVPDEYLDFVFAFNVFVQLELEDIVGYLQEIKRVLKPGGTAALHYAVISNQAGWDYFLNNCRAWMRHPKPRSRFCELTLSTMRLLSERLSLHLLQNQHVGRDAMMVIEKPATVVVTPPPSSAENGHFDILRKLHRQSPYADFPRENYPEDVQGWHSQHPLFAHLIRDIRPGLVIEVGTWKGGSAIHMADLLRQSSVAGKIVCVDTWLGALEFWLSQDDPIRYKALRHQFGYPTVYHQFLANVLHRQHQDVITPFPQTSQIAARWFAHHQVQADMIYLDGSHDEPDVAADLSAYWPLVRAGGALFGDDYTRFWPGVVKAVTDFAREQSLTPEAHDGFWLIRRRN